VAPLTDHDSVEDPPAVMLVGLAVNEEIVGAGGVVLKVASGDDAGGPPATLLVTL